MATLIAVAQNNRTNPDEAEYFIKGYLSIEGKSVYKLSQIDNQGIYFENPHATRVGRENEKEENVLFQFSHASTTYPGGINTELNFWRYDESIHEWQPDGETRQGTAGMEDKKSMVVMLVLDCSSSIDKDFVIVQEGAKAFIQSLYEASNGIGNIKLGIVSFSKINETKFFNIRPLTSNSYYDMNRFINSLSTQNGTALYYAMDKSIELMEEYCKNSIPSDEPLSAAVMVTFTDGLDQTSRDSDKDILTADAYYDEVLSKYGTKMQRVSVNGIPLQPEIRGVKGNDIITDAQLSKFQRIGESLGNFKRLNDYSELGKAFGDIAQNLIDQWRILNLYVPNSFSGRVAWTYPSKKQVVVEKPKEPRKRGKFMFGVNVGLGIANHSGFEDWYNEETDFKTSFITESLGFDFAFPINEKIHLGFLTSVGYGYDKIWHDYISLNVGPLVLVNLNNKGSLYLGGEVYIGIDSESGVTYLNDVAGLGIRVGYKFTNGLYLFLENNYYGGEKDGYYYYCKMRGNNLLFHVGYSF